MSLSALLDRALNHSLHAAGSRRAIGYLGWNVPIELILAADATPVQLAEFSPTGATALADRFLENSFSAQSRAVAQRWLAGELDSLEAVIFSRSDDSAQRLYYYLCELQRLGECKGPKPLLYDLARIRRGTSVAHTIDSTKALAAAIGADYSRLSTAIQRVRSRQTLLGELHTLRMADEVPLGAVAHRILRGARADWSEDLDRSLKEWLANHATVEPRKRVLLIGSVPANDALHSAIEVDGAVVVAEINEASTSMIATTHHASMPIEQIAHRCYNETNGVSSLLQSPSSVVELARGLRVDCVVVWMLATDTGLAWQAPRIEQAMREAGLPTLMLTSQPESLSADALDRITQFRRTLEVR